jgi:hypothetical protein
MMHIKLARWLPGAVVALAGLAVAPEAHAAAGDPDGVVASRTLGQSRHGRSLIVHRLSHPGIDAHGRGPDQRPALLILAGVDGRHRVGTAVAEGLVPRLAEAFGGQEGDLLRTRTVYIVPLLNPDNAAWHADRAVPLSEFGRTVAPYDADRDRRVNEDPANDIDGDGLITTMRVYRPRPETGLVAEWIIDPDDPRLMKRPDAAKGEVATHAVLIEGIDDDGDGRFNEDGPGGTAGGGVDLNMNFPALWPEFTDGAGEFALCEPESHALAEWVLARNNIQAVIIYGLHDNLVNAPVSGRMDATGRVPLGIEDGDKPYHDEISRVFKDITGMTGAPRPETAGSPGSWMYAHLGLPTFMTPVWVRPDLVKGEGRENPPPPPPAEAEERGPDLSDAGALAAMGVPEPVIQFMTGAASVRTRLMQEYTEAPPEAKAQIDAAIASLPPEVQARLAIMMADPAAAPDGGAGARAGAGGRERGPSRRAGAEGENRKRGDGDDHKWLAYIDDHLEGRGFVAWREIDHPQLGRVEVGGFGPHVRLNPPTDELDRLAAEQTRFALAVLDRLPDVAVSVRSVERLGQGLYRIAVVGRNAGYLPTVSAIGQKANRLAPVVLVLEAPMERILTGARQQRWASIPGSGGEAHAQWLVHAPDGSTVDLTVRSPGFGDRRISITLEEARR